MDRRSTEPISSYGAIGNCRTAALVSSRGSIDWACFPHFDSQSYFGALLDRGKGGFFSISPSDRGVASSQSYVPDTNILTTTFTARDGGRVRLYDAFSVTSEARKRGRFWPGAEITRVIEGVSGELELELRYRPRPAYGRRGVKLEHRGRLGLASTTDRSLLLLQCDLPARALVLHESDEGGHEARARFMIRAGERRFVSLIHSREAPAIIPPLGESLLERFEETRRYWREWSAHCAYKGPYEAAVRRAALALKLLTFAPSGAVVAALTTSLPERLGGVRNWDYRFCWLRDAALTIRALESLGYIDEASAFLDWLLHSTRLTRPHLQSLYTVYGETRLRERELAWLEGYGASAPVRVGNAAVGQFQLDVYGEVLSSIYQLAPHVGGFDRETRNFILSLGSAVRELWRLPDEGIWEERAGRAHHTHSKVMCWVAIDRLSRIARRLGWKAPLDEYRALAACIRGRIERFGFSAGLRSYTRTLGGGELDAAVLTMPLFGYTDAHSRRMRQTCEAVERELSSKGLVYRYRHVDDGLPGREGAFGICSFWLVENHARAGALALARLWFERILARANPVGLWSEEIDPASGAFLGNYPQGFSHIGLINAAVSLGRAHAGKECAAA